MDIQELLHKAEIRIENIIDSLNIKNLRDYTIGSTAGLDLLTLYKLLIESIVDDKVLICGKEIGNGKYNIKFTMPNKKIYSTVSKRFFQKPDIKEFILQIFYYYLEDIIKENGNNMKHIIPLSPLGLDYIEASVVIMMEHRKIFFIEIYRDEDSAIEAFENWIELSYDDYISGYPMDNAYEGSIVLRLPVISG